MAGYWYRRVKDHLLTPRNPEEQHIVGARGIGVELEPCGLSVPYGMEVLFARKVEEVEDEDVESGENKTQILIYKVQSQRPEALYMPPVLITEQVR